MDIHPAVKPNGAGRCNRHPNRTYSIERIQMNTTNQNIFDLINNLDTSAKLPALRAVVHTGMARTIGSIRQDIRQRQRTVRNEDSILTSLDQRNDIDENARAEDEVKAYFGFPVDMPLLKQASIFHAVYDWALADLKTLATSTWDMPLTPKAMLDFMMKKARPLDRQLIRALADAAKTDEATIVKFHELQDQREREQLAEMAPEILATFEGFGENGYEDAIDELPAFVQHQLGIKVAEGLKKAKDQVLTRVMRSRRLSELGSIALIDEGLNAVSEWVKQFELKHRDEIAAALESGRNVRTLEDAVL
jgi:hypothetical protein